MLEFLTLENTKTIIELITSLAFLAGVIWAYFAFDIIKPKQETQP